MEKNYVWRFTNQKKLTKKEFEHYFERKIFKTIRKYDMLPKRKIIKLKKSENLNTRILKEVLEKKFKVEYSNTQDFSDESASDISEVTIKNLLKGKLTGPLPNEKTKKPLYFHTDKEIGLYAKLKKIKGKPKKRDQKIHNLLKKFLDKNQDLEQNIIKALKQIKET